MLADLATLKQWVGAVSDADDANLQLALDQANAYWQPRIYEEDWLLDDVQGGVIDTAARWWNRRRSPEGVGGFNDFGAIRIVARDPDIRWKMAPHTNMLEAGVA